MYICALKHSLIHVESRIFISVPLGASIKWTGEELRGNLFSPSGTGSKSGTKTCTFPKTRSRTWKALSDLCALLLSLGPLLYFLTVCHWHSQHPGERLVLSQQRLREIGTSWYIFYLFWGSRKGGSTLYPAHWWERFPRDHLPPFPLL